MPPPTPSFFCCPSIINTLDDTSLSTSSPTGLSLCITARGVLKHSSGPLDEFLLQMSNKPSNGKAKATGGTEQRSFLSSSVVSRSSVYGTAFSVLPSSKY